MGTKRSADSGDSVSFRRHSQSQKKARLSPLDEASINVSEPRSSSISQDSASRSTPAISKHVRASSISSIKSVYESNDEVESSFESSPSSSSDSESGENTSSNEDEDEFSTREPEEIVTIGGTKKPSMSIEDVQKSRMNDLHGRLQTMLVQLAQANEELAEKGGQAYNIENVEEGEAHIEMNLGLGVLEEKRVEESSSEDETSSGEDNGPAYEDGTEHHAGVDKTLQRKYAKSDAMCKLLGRQPDQNKAKIEVLP